MEEGTVKASDEEMENDELNDMYLNFNVGNELYGIGIRCVIQIVGMQEISEMPEMSNGMKGFINLRGNVIPVVSMRLRMGKMENEYTDRVCIIVVQMEDKEVGLIVDAIQETVSIEPKDVMPPPNVDDASTVPYVTGVARLSDRRNVILLDVQKMFGNDYF